MDIDTKIGLEQTCMSLKPYQKPELEELGDLRDITLGSSMTDPWCGVKSGQTHCPPLGKHPASSNKFPGLFETQETLQPKKKY